VFIFYLFFFFVISDVLSIFVLCTGHCKAVFFFVNLYSSVLFLFHMFNSCLCYLIFFSAFFYYIFFFPFLCISCLLDSWQCLRVNGQTKQTHWPPRKKREKQKISEKNVSKEGQFSYCSIEKELSKWHFR
jgi:hypothetical protein